MRETSDRFGRSYSPIPRSRSKSGAEAVLPRLLVVLALVLTAAGSGQAGNLVRRSQDETASRAVAPVGSSLEPAERPQNQRSQTEPNPSSVSTLFFTATPFVLLRPRAFTQQEPRLSSDWSTVFQDASSERKNGFKTARFIGGAVGLASGVYMITYMKSRTGGPGWANAVGWFYAVGATVGGTSMVVTSFQSTLRRPPNRSLQIPIGKARSRMQPALVLDLDAVQVRATFRVAW